MAIAAPAWPPLGHASPTCLPLTHRCVRVPAATALLRLPRPHRCACHSRTAAPACLPHRCARLPSSFVTLRPQALTPPPSPLAPLLPTAAVILASDGLWDNLWLEDVRGVLAKQDFAPCHAYVRAMRTRALEQVAVERELAADGGVVGRVLEDRKYLGIKPDVVTDAEVANMDKQCRAWLQSLAAQLVVASQRVGADPVARSPFAVNAAQHVPQWRYKGGKMDDVAVVAALLLPDPALVPNE
jgi:hypothetical protein